MMTSKSFGLIASLAAVLVGCANSDELTGGSTGTNPSDGGGGSTENGTRPDGGAGGNGATTNGFGGEQGLGGNANCTPVEETCDGVDNDCDGTADEDCDCDPGTTQPCFSGDPQLVGVGLCAEGTQTCDEFGKWSVICDGEVGPTEEVCDGDDNDCNGMADEGFGMLSCGIGPCATTVPECEDGELGECIAIEPPDPVDDCDGEDDNCNGTADEGCACVNGDTQPCYMGPPEQVGMGICSAGTQTCTGGQWGSCTGQVGPATEVCDNIDQDCDGNIAEGPCSGANASTSCVAGGCVINACNAGFANCDNNAGNGCEVRNSGSSNTTPEYLGDYAADAFFGGGCGSVGCEGPILSRSGTRGRLFDITALESSSCCSYVALQFQLVVPPGVDYDLVVSGNGCYADPDSFESVGPAGADELVTVWCEDDCFGGDDGFDLGVDVIYYSGSSCEPWTLNVYRREC